MGGVREGGRDLETKRLRDGETKRRRDLGTGGLSELFREDGIFVSGRFSHEGHGGGTKGAEVFGMGYD